MKSIKVLLVDDQFIMLDGLKAILETDEQLCVVGFAKDGEEAIRMANDCAPDVVLMDIRMQRMNGVEATRMIKHNRPEIAVLMLTTFDDQEYIVEALQNGASGYLLKDIGGEQLILAVKDASHGDTILPSRIAGKLLDRLMNPAQSRMKKLRDCLGLSEREAELALMLSDGFTNKQIASAMFLSEGTTKNYVSNIYRKLGVEERARAVLRLVDILDAPSS